jgi:hypothetical protein
MSRLHTGGTALIGTRGARRPGRVVCMSVRLGGVLELDHVIRFVPREDAADVNGFTPGPGRAHSGQSTRNMRVMFRRS